MGSGAGSGSSGALVGTEPSSGSGFDVSSEGGCEPWLSPEPEPVPVLDDVVDEPADEPAEDSVADPLPLPVDAGDVDALPAPWLRTACWEKRAASPERSPAWAWAGEPGTVAAFVGEGSTVLGSVTKLAWVPPAEAMAKTTAAAPVLASAAAGTMGGRCFR